jgi:CDP-glycerol glycerophosphotransferase (TagB/SpsB family)
MKHHSNATIFQMGYPRYDPFFNDFYNKALLAKTLKLNMDKKTIVWLPTWQALSSIDLFAEKMATLTQKYNVIVKCHPLSKEHEPDKIEKLKKLPFHLLITDNYDNLKLFCIADFVFSDYGGTAFGALYLDKKLVLLNTHQPENDPLTGKSSPDILLRQDIINIDNTQFHLLKGMLNNQSDWEQQKLARKKLRDKYFVPSYGFSADLAALAIANFAKLI